MALIEADVVDVVDDLPTRPIIVANVDDLTRDEWLELRREGIGGSDAAAVAGLSRWSSPFATWLDKTGAPGQDEDSEQAMWGRILEAPVRDEVMRRTGEIIAPFPFMLAHPDRPWQRVNLDGLVSNVVGDIVGVYEGKTAGVFAADGWADGGVPDGYVLQGQHALDVTGLDSVLYGVLIGGQRLEVRWVLRDDELIEHLRSIEAEFWQRVVDQRPPDPMAVDSDLLAHLWDVKADAVVTVDPAEVLPIIEAREAAAADVKAAEARKADADNQLKVLMGEAVALVAPDGTQLVRWPEYERRAVDLDLLRTAHTQIAESCTKTTTYRRLSIPKRKA